MKLKKHIHSARIFLLSLLALAGNVANLAAAVDSIVVDGMVRTYSVHVPPGYADGNTTLPVVFGLHGLGGSASQFEQYYRFSEKADESGFIAVYPNGVARHADNGRAVQSWNAGDCCSFAAQEQLDDVHFISQLIDKVLEEYRIDPKRVYVTGMSNGGMMAYRLAAEIPSKIAAIAPVACTLVFTPPAIQKRSIPILHLHAITDNTVPYAGKAMPMGYRFASVDSVLQVWVKRDGCKPTPQISQGDGYTRKQWMDNAGEPFIVHYATDDGGHSWPGSEPVRQGATPPSKAINANDLIWDFFQHFLLP